MMRISEKTEKIFTRAQQGVSNSFAGGMQKGMPPILRCGGIAGEIQELTLCMTDAAGKQFQMQGPELLGDDSTLFLVDLHKGKVRFSVVVDGNEATSEDQAGSFGYLRAVAVQRLGMPFAISAEWDQRIDQVEEVNSLLSGSDNAFIEHVRGLIRLEGK